MNTVALVIAIGTFTALAFMPLLFTLPGTKFRRFNRIGAWILSILILPCIYLETGYSLIIAGWLACCTMAALSRFDLTTTLVREEEPIPMEFADLPRISASEKIQNLERLARLKASGVISSEEFDSEKKNFLG